MTTRTRRLLLLALIALAIVAPAYMARHVILGSVGRFLTAGAPLSRAEVAFVTPESGKAGEIEAADLYRRAMVSSVVILEPNLTAVERELVRRGVSSEPDSLDRLRQLGVSTEHLAVLNAGEGGTTASVLAIGGWFARHQDRSIVVITGRAHRRRFGRALAREWNGPGPTPQVHPASFGAFAADSWWQHRQTLREGIVELQKLLLDYLSHPL